ncbi:unnamed protein product [Rotaria socialis]|uniref:Reverse transcriptase domain-containing protein n=1 Tax=Rotaria socialis TaxID=392032 RepID=A0A820TXS2_9BILA|nr:unnamed protein product [Rotaria socialis]
MLPQEESLDILIEFLVQHGYQKVQNIPIDIIRKLALIVIKENVFVYEKKFYRQVIGGAMGSAFTLTLANIFMWKWERQLVHRLEVSNEIYGRYVDDIFFTSNDSFESIDQMLDEANNFHPNIKLVRQIGRSVPFLDVFIHNSKGALKTSVYHKEAAEPYVVPFGSDHPGHVFRNTVDTAITRAVRYSTTLLEFEEEIRQMKLMYPPRHIHRQLTTLFSKYLSKYFILPMLNNSDDFNYLRHQLLTTSTATTYDKPVENLKQITLQNLPSLIDQAENDCMKHKRNRIREERELENRRDETSHLITELKEHMSQHNVNFKDISPVLKSLLKVIPHRALQNYSNIHREFLELCQTVVKHTLHIDRSSPMQYDVILVKMKRISTIKTKVFDDLIKLKPTMDNESRQKILVHTMKPTDKTAKVTEERNYYAVEICKGICDKLDGSDPDPLIHSSIREQVRYTICEATAGAFEGDIILPPQSLLRGLTRIGSSVQWPDGIVPYEIMPGYQAEQEAIIIGAMRKIESLTAINNVRCIQFRPRDVSDLYYTIIQDGTGYSSPVTKVFHAT